MHNAISEYYPKNPEENFEKKPLFIFTYRGEAQFFFEQFSFIRHITLPLPCQSKIFEFQQGYISLTGSSHPKDNIESLLQVLEKLGESVSFVILLGFAGALKKNLFIGETVLIKRVAATNANEEKNCTPLRKCFYSHHPQAQCNAITHTHMVQSTDAKKKLSVFADIVDMELYWQAMAVEQYCQSCQTNVSPFSIDASAAHTPYMPKPCFFLKIISDYADESTDLKKMRPNIPKWSKMLFEATTKICFDDATEKFVSEKHQNKNSSLKNSIGTENFLRKKTELWAKYLIHKLLKNIDGNLSFRERKDLEECIISELRTECLKEKFLEDAWVKVEKKWLSKQKEQKESYLKKYLWKKTQKNMI